MDQAVGNIADGTPVDWGAIEGSGERDGTNAWVGNLHIIQDVANFYRLSACDTGPVPHSTPDEEATVEVVVGEERAARYNAALRQLTRVDRHAVIGRLELLSSYGDLAAVLGYRYWSARASAGAARRAVTRALRHLAVEMGHV
ncbi:MAG TPA: hypothetical protein VKB50_10600 [Vicinamibacterales bacterium]|nr:hypothetical protein [Vicinamibacterales bacterium]